MIISTEADAVLLSILHINVQFLLSEHNQHIFDDAADDSTRI